MEGNKIIRRRVNFSQTTKGLITTNVTFEGTNISKDEVLTGAIELLKDAMVIAKENSL